MHALKLADTRQMPREKWLALRRQGMGGSDAAAILGLNPWKSAMSVYYEKVHGSEAPQSLAMELGRELEPFLRRKFAHWLKEQEGFSVTVQEVPFLLQHPDHPILLANLDGCFDHPELGPCGLELKTAGEFMRAAWDAKDIPDTCYIQVQHYMAVTGLAHFYVAYLIGNREFGATRVPRNETMIGELVSRLREFWETYVLRKITPAPAGLACDTEILKGLYPREGGRTISLPDCQDKYDAYKALKQEEKRLQLELEAIRQHFMAAMGEADTALVGRHKVTWKTVERRGYTVAPSSYRQLRFS
ncbi:MAG: hypothetical protein C4554_04740 [Dethiobacter sp.]|jgi:putative phage-type endonuclease|nr:MAG: hypothetical protein C4554_04740 [Dethiobacter sp.]